MERWISTAVGKMHTNKITQIELAKHMGVTNDWISLILRGKRTPKNARERIMTAINEIISEKKQ